MIRLVCGNCGKIGYFKDWDEAFSRNWDTVRDFGYNACDSCPGVSVYFPQYYAQLARATVDPEKREALLEKAAAATMEWDFADNDKRAAYNEQLKGAEDIRSLLENMGLGNLHPAALKQAIIAAREGKDAEEIKKEILDGGTFSDSSDAAEKENE